MVLQRRENAGERIELFRGECVCEVLLDRSDVGRGRAPENPRSLGCQDDLGAPVVGGAVLPADQVPSLHPLEVMGQRSQSMALASSEGRTRLPLASLSASST